MSRPHTFRATACAVVVVALLAATSSVRAQATSNVVCNSTFDWALNQEKQNPCLVSANLMAQCNAGQWSVNTLPAGWHYTGPAFENANDCQCSSVAYSLMAVCGKCQNLDYITWYFWSFNCSQHIVPNGSWNQRIPADTSVPKWAYTDPDSTEGTFNMDHAKSIAAQNLPDEMGTTSVHPSSTTNSAGPSTTTSANGQPSNKADKGGGTNKAAIGAGVAGGLVGLGIVVGAIAFCLRRKKKKKERGQYQVAQPLSPHLPAHDANTFYSDNPSVPHDGQTVSSYPAPMRLYDPNDPSTFPQNTSTDPSMSQSMTHSTFSHPASSFHPASSEGMPQHRPGQYNGIAEI